LPFFIVTVCEWATSPLSSGLMYAREMIVAFVLDRVTTVVRTRSVAGKSWALVVTFSVGWLPVADHVAVTWGRWGIGSRTARHAKLLGALGAQFGEIGVLAITALT